MLKIATSWLKFYHNGSFYACLLLIGLHCPLSWVGLDLCILVMSLMLLCLLVSMDVSLLLHWLEYSVASLCYSIGWLLLSLLATISVSLLANTDGSLFLLANADLTLFFFYSLLADLNVFVSMGRHWLMSLFLLIVQHFSIHLVYGWGQFSSQFSS